MLKRLIFGALIFLGGTFAALYVVFPPISATHPALQSGLPNLVPLRDYYADSQSSWRYRLSPDGKYISWLEAKRLKPALWVRPLHGDDTEVFQTKDEVRWYQWAANSKYLLYQADRDGWENDVIVSIDVSQPGGTPRTYDFGKDVKSWIHSVPEEGGAEILVGHNGRDRSTFDLYRLNLDTGETTPLHIVSELGVSWRANRNGAIYARSVIESPDDWRTELMQADGSWLEIAHGGMEEQFSVVAEPDENGHLLALSSLKRDKLAFVRFDPATGTEDVLFQDEVVDTRWVELHPKTSEPLSAVAYPNYQKRVYFNADYEALMARIPHDEHDSFHRVSSTKDVSKMIVEVESSTKGWSQYLIDAGSGEITPISTPGIARKSQDLSDMRPVRFPARDGLTLHATLTRPKGVEGPGPMVIFIHGGPVARSSWGWNSFHSWMANRGYAVLDINYRGSAGFGREFREAAVGEVSRKMHFDVVDARAWAVEQGIADPDKVAVFGGSFGGLKVMTALTESPDLFAAGINVNGISDISTMLQEVPAYWQGWPTWYLKYIGNPDDPEELAEIKARSPLYNAEKIEAPVLIIQGANDVRVIQDQADRMVDALETAGKDVDYVLLKDAGHQWNNWGWKARILAYRRMERFLAEHLGGRADGFDYAILGAHILP